MFETVHMLAGLGWDPEIRGLLTVVLGLAVLGGSVWLLLVTNTGTRLGSLIALAGFFGWMFVMGIFWWIYGIGWVGAAPSWEVEDAFIDAAGYEVAGIGDAFVGNVDQLPDSNCYNGDVSFPPAGGVATVGLSSQDSSRCTPRAIEVLMAFPGPEREIVIREWLNPQAEESKIDRLANDLFDTPMAEPISMLQELDRDQRNQIFDAIVEFRYNEIAEGIIEANNTLGPDDPRYLSDTSSPYTLQERIEIAQDALTVRSDGLSLTALKGVSSDIVDWAEDEGFLQLSGWDLQSNSQSGEAQANADAFLREELFPDGNFVVLDAFQQGGKDKRSGSNLWDRISHKVASTAQITHPTNYTVINVQQTLDLDVDPALPPPPDVIDPDAPVYSVVLIRNLGNLRLIPALFTIINLVLFLLTCAVLHWRDLELRERGLDV